MKKSFLFLLLLSVCFVGHAAFVSNMPVARIQPNGDTLRCYVTGDEYYHRLHDAAGYTIVQNSSTGWYCYARRVDDANGEWHLEPTSLIAGRDNPSAKGLLPGLAESPATVAARIKAWQIPNQYKPQLSSQRKSTFQRNRGKINNIVIFIRFADDEEITTPYSSIEAMFNDSTADAVSLHNYFWRASYGQLRIPTYFYPQPADDVVVSYCDSLPRNRYLPYDATTNPDGYQDDYQRQSLEFGLLERAVNHVSLDYPEIENLDLDYDDDGMVDNICFVLKGSFTGWSDLLWPHKWAIFDRYVMLGTKRVYNFNLQLEGSGSHYFSTSTFCHEMFHTLGAPDLYHYENYTGVNTVGSWDLMCYNTTPPQHMGMYMKMRYGNWIDSVPEIKESGTYSLHSVGDSNGRSNCYVIKASDPSQCYFLEYRDYNELFEQALPGSGLLVYRIDSRYNGNAYFDGETVFDEVHLFAPGGDNDTTSGSMAQAFFSADAGRDAFTPLTDPRPWLTGGALDTTMYITNISHAGDSITFTYERHWPAGEECQGDSCTITVTMRDVYGDTWNGAYLTFSTLDGTPLANISMAVCRTVQTESVHVCRQPIVVSWNGGSYPEECGFSITLADGTVWNDVVSAEGQSEYVGVIDNPCGSGEQFTVTVVSADTVNTVEGGGLFDWGTYTLIRAIPAEGYIFRGWLDGEYHNTGNAYEFANDDPERLIMVTSDTLFTGVFERTQGIRNGEDDIRISVDGNTVRIQGQQGQQIEIYDIMGRLIISDKTLSDHSAYTMPHRGVYIIRTNNSNRSVMIY